MTGGFTLDCIFCKIIAGEIPSKKVYENEHVLAFHDLSPRAPVHILVIPKEHIASAAEISAENSVYVAKIFEAIPEIAEAAGVKEGFRVVTNSGTSVGQSVMHLHFHLLGGRAFSWPPG
ncbi:MAG: histidine triad nucleotide-binding protein [Clostridiales bacterium]|nr:histidine triad nucleotide-binding protein [Clostridiales bacterium]